MVPAPAFVSNRCSSPGVALGSGTAVGRMMIEGFPTRQIDKSMPNFHRHATAAADY